MPVAHLAHVVREISHRHAGWIYVGLRKSDDRSARFGIVLQFRTAEGKHLYGWCDDASDTVVIAETPPAC